MLILCKEILFLESKMKKDPMSTKKMIRKHARLFLTAVFLMMIGVHLCYPKRQTKVSNFNGSNPFTAFYSDNVPFLPMQGNELKNESNPAPITCEHFVKKLIPDFEIKISGYGFYILLFSHIKTKSYSPTYLVNRVLLI